VRAPAAQAAVDVPASARRLDVDWARGLAVLIMIHAHVLDAWTDPSQRSTLAFQYLNILAGFAAPLFLWLAGVSLVLSGERLTAWGADRVSASGRLAARGLELFVLAFAFRLLMFLFNPGGSPLSIFRVDILNIMGPALVVVAGCWGVLGGPVSRLVVFSGLSALVALVTPVVREAGWIDSLPVWLQWYVRPTGEHTVFTLFPWTGFVFAGAGAGTLVAASRRRDTERQVHLWTVSIGLALILLGAYASTLPSLYRHSSFWSTSPAFFAIRVGVLLLGGAGLYWASGWLARRGVRLTPLTRLGRASLLIYCVHIPIVYGWMTASLRHHLHVWQTVCAFVAFSAAMYGLVPLRDRLAGIWADRRSGDRQDRAQMQTAK